MMFLIFKKSLGVIGEMKKWKKKNLKTPLTLFFQFQPSPALDNVLRDLVNTHFGAFFQQQLK